MSDGPRTVHLVRETARYAIGLLGRGAPADRRRAERALGWESNVEAVVAAAGRWSFPGLQVVVTTDGTLRDGRTQAYAPASGAGTHMSLTFV